MKRLLTVCLLIFGFLGLSAGYAGDGKLSKVLQKEYKKQLKQLKKEGWAVWGKTQSLESALMAHYLKLEESGIGAVNIEGHGTSKDPNMAIRKAQSNASNQFASMKSTTIQGETNTQMKVDSENGEHTSFDTAFRSSTSQSIKNFTPSLLLYRTLKDGNSEVIALFIVAPDAE